MTDIFSLDGCKFCGRIKCHRDHAAVQRPRFDGSNPLSWARGSIFRLRARLVNRWNRAQAEGRLATMERVGEALMLVDDTIDRYTR